MRMLVSGGMRARLYSPVDQCALLAGYDAAPDLVGDLLLGHRRELIESCDDRHVAFLRTRCRAFSREYYIRRRGVRNGQVCLAHCVDGAPRLTHWHGLTSARPRAHISRSRSMA